MWVSSVVVYSCYKAMYTVQSLFFMLQNNFMNCIEFLGTWMLHSCCNKTCIEYHDLFWFAMSNASRWCTCNHSTWKSPLRSWYYFQVLKMMQRVPCLSYNRTALTMWRPQIWENAIICTLQHISGVLGIIPDGGRHCCYLVDTWHVVQ